jgi:hypothetical protein
MINLETLTKIILSSNGEDEDITDLITGIDIFQNIYDPFITGTLSLIDTPSSRLSKRYDELVIGKGEELKFGLRTKTLPASRSNELLFEKYFVYKVQVLPLDITDGMFKQIVILHFCSSNMFLNEFKKVQGHYFDTISNIVKKISKDYLDIPEENMVIEETDDKQFITIPYFNPLKAINWLSSRAFSTPKNNESKTPIEEKKKEIINNNYVFFEDIDHKFYFVSLGTLLKRKAILGTKDLDGIRIETAPSEVLNSEDSNGKVTYRGSFAALQHTGKPICPLSNAKNGMYSSSCLTFDLTRKKYAKNIFNYKEEFETQNHVYEKPLLNTDLDSRVNIFHNVFDNPQTVVKYYPKCSYLFSSNENPLNGNTPTNTVDKWSLRRLSAMESMDQLGVDVEIRGNVGIRLGDVVNFSRPQLDNSLDPSTAYGDPLFTGKFLITKIKHTLENRGDNFGFNLRTSLSLRRDSYYIPNVG